MDTRETQSCRNPEEKSNPLSYLCFGWTADIFWKGATRDLQISDLYDPLKSDESERLGDRLEREWNMELAKANKVQVVGKNGKTVPSGKPSLGAAIARMFWARYMIQGLLMLVQSAVLRVYLPVLQGWVVSHFNPGVNPVSRNDAILYAGLLILTNLLVIFTLHHTGLRNRQIGMCVRVACCSIIYRKVLRLNQAAVNNTAAGQVSNLISNDVARFDIVPLYFHHLWIMPIQVSIMGYIMWRSVGVAAVVGVASVTLQNLPIQMYLGRLGANLRAKIASKTDERVQKMKELISGIQIVKMYSWEEPFEIVVSTIRALEIRLIKYTSYLRGFYLSVILFSERLSLYFTLFTFVMMGNSLTAEITFVISSFFSVMMFTCVVCVPQAIIMAGETAVTLERLTEFLLLDEVQCLEDGKNKLSKEIRSEPDVIEVMKRNWRLENGVGIEMKNVAANWILGKLPPTLCEVSLTIRSKSLSVLVGPVGSGKSSLLHLILGELPVGAGNLSLYAGENKPENKITSRDISISYTSQDPWLFSGSIRENILFGQPYDKNRYQEVTKVCALLKDFAQLPQGDLSYVGEGGASLSGGQRARVNLARAIYRDADLYLLDDPLSAVDAHVGRHLFDECINGFLKGKTRILVTHQLQHLKQADVVIVLNRGKVVRQGAYEEVATLNLDSIVSQSVEPEVSTIEIEYAVESQEEKIDFTKLQTEKLNGKAENKSEATEASKESGDLTEEQMATGEISNKVYWEYFRSGGNICSLIFFLVIFVTGQIAASGTDYWITHWTNQETLRISLSLNKSSTVSNQTVDQTENTGHLKWFDEYGVIRPIVAVYVYTFCIAGCVFFAIFRSVLFMKLCMNASQNIHNTMFSNLLQATMRFFNTNPTGRILNRFSKDIGTMDELLPRTMLEAFQIFMYMIGILVMIAIVNTWLILPIILMSGIFYVIRSYYLKTAQNIKRLECVTKSPVFSHVSSTLDGLTTIRSRGPRVEELLQKEFDRYQDAHTGAWYLTITTATALGFVMDIISCVFIACVCFTLILTNAGDTLPGSVGLAISQSLMLTGILQYGVRQGAEVISLMTSVERVLQYTNLPKEGPFKTDNPPSPSWPSKGALAFNKMSMRYAAEKPLVLKDLNVAIEPGQKIGIVGRTGAGKSSLISALFRLSGDGLEGEINLDGIDTKSIGLHELRPRISIIPQEPILFSASMRYNLDPFDQFSDAELWDSLREVELHDDVTSLDFKVAGGGANFSVGQRQLICLARAILRKNRILVLDEATANIDPSTDALIQNTIRRKFADCTVLTIAHRLNTIMDSDKVLVMDGGRIAEYGHPYLLLENRYGSFSQMLRQTGKSMAEQLSEIAERAYRSAISNEDGSDEKLNEERRIAASVKEVTYL
ncbi:ATP-binding cassette subfamily C member 4-like isoform X1 [Neodiprion virginianus]|uniref:ATP-binding cassette subfamily C member 4-like isoform X1 n=1 Tax=Neodiprion virginianus TaxID=2961670 RepID=UPI001EE6BC4B|nr:ATP-binding cassette subfamily C member 4-like isoform X1 [Neodiprion virginianus]XP_046619155.1 ATP-binding cassette subfamily C member 4-like isoform X1 [Neodiprion virginianus]XP_046619156.1 ATP-binding cassette subfamily C member 4-like isoform X1 [Neodiprion virginianus]XP_046619157.1 ATP-binding cassette subfamily C member 4-like isoform X1 [Neodiprion virginianus]XP_046619159.1 ATP-binding cassette subfamily C member 4-like isoform X1 [Neodiprion virginianus]